MKKRYLFLMLFIVGCNSEKNKLIIPLVSETKHKMIAITSKHSRFTKDLQFMFTKNIQVNIDENILNIFSKKDTDDIFRNIQKKLAQNNLVSCASYYLVRNQVFLVLSSDINNCSQGKKSIVGNIEEKDLKQMMLTKLLLSVKKF